MKLHPHWISIVFSMAAFIAGFVCFLKGEVPTACYLMGFAIWCKMDANRKIEP